jgi:tetratricopeptide (TPR) repeat protein
MSRFAIFLAASIFACTSSLVSEGQTLERLAHETTPDLPDSRVAPVNPSRISHSVNSAALHDSALSRSAAHALFVESNPKRAQLQAALALREDPQDAEAVFVRMEAAGMQGDAADTLEAAVRLCELGTDAQGDPRVALAAARVRELAANVPAFRKAIPRLQMLLANWPEGWRDLHEALLRAAMDGDGDGAPGLDPYSISRGAGVVTDWRVVGPLGLHSSHDDQPLLPGGDDLAQASYQNRLVENFQFPDGRIVLPNYLAHRGVFYASSSFAALTAGNWTVQVESSGPLEVFIDGHRVLHADSGRSLSGFDVAPGPHRILLKLAATAGPLRIALFKTVEETRAYAPHKTSPQEITYLLAAAHYAAAEYALAINQIAGVPSSNNSAALQFLLAQSQQRNSPTTSELATAWDKPTDSSPLAPANAIEADPWPQRIAAHPSCKVLRDAIAYYRDHNQFDEARSAQQKLNGCAPESLDYAQSLSDDGKHGEAVNALHRLLAAAPLNRAARQMLVRELQLSGDDEAAQRAAAEWLRVAPNAIDYRRLAAESIDAGESETKDSSTAAAFYLRYRRDAGAIARQSANLQPVGASILLINDRVAIARADGSISLYVHSTRRVLTEQAAEEFSNTTTPQGAQLLAFRVIHPDGTTTAIVSSPWIAPGDAIDEEYVEHYSGDSGIAEHCEAFQFVFGSFNAEVLRSRFVVLTPAGSADRGAVIATGEPPAMSATVHGEMLERVWEQDASVGQASDGATSGVGSVASRGLAIVRVVEEENGWNEPSSAEHHHRIETIHRGPRPANS